MESPVDKIVSFVKDMPHWQRLLAGLALVWLIAWAVSGAAAALTFALGALNGFVAGHSFGAREK